jgi:trigger factor
VVDVTFPAEYGAQDLAGKAAQFTITAKALKIYSKPAMDDELAKKIGMESFDKLREAIMLSLQNEYDQQSRLRIKRALLDALAERAAFAVPDSLLDGEFSTIWQRVEADMKAGKLDGDDVGKDEDVGLTRGMKARDSNEDRQEDKKDTTMMRIRYNDDEDTTKKIRRRGNDNEGTR